MKRFLLAILLATSLSSYGQKVRVDVKQDSTDFMENGALMYPPCKLELFDPLAVYIAKKKGYVTQGFTFSELLKKTELDAKGRPTYTIDLEKIKSLPTPYTSKIIEVYKVVDKTGRIIEFNFSDPFFTTELAKKLASFGYTNLANKDLFDSQKAQLQIVGEITQFSRNTIGPRFQISLIVDWSVYDMTENKVVLQYSTAGFSSTESRFKNELGYALRNALVGLMSNETFQQIANANTTKKE